MQWEIMFETAHTHGFVCQNLHAHDHVSQKVA